MTPQVSADAGFQTRTAVVIPLRSLSEGKLRLRDALSDDERKQLIRAMAETVVRSAHDLPVFVVHDDADVANWAADLGAEPLQATEPGLNRAVCQARNLVGSRGFDHVIIAHADLPRATDLRNVTGFAGITIVPDRIRDGTNVLCVPTSIDFQFSYGPSSFGTHLRLAEASGQPVRVLDDPELAWDIDHPDDLALLPQDAPVETPLEGSHP